MAGSLTRIAGRRSRRVALVTIGSLAVVFLTGYGWYLAGKNFTFFSTRPLRLKDSALAIRPGVYVLGGLAPSAAYVVETSQGLILVDSGLASDASPLKAQMAQLGLDWKHVRAIFLTHAHGDHTGGAQALRAATGAKVYAGEGDVAVLQAGQPREAFFSNFYMPDHGTHPTTIDVALRGGEVIPFGDVRIQAIATPGHTPGSTCYLLERKKFRALFGGDVIMMLRGDERPRTELGKPLGTYSAYLPPRYRGDAKSYLESLKRLRLMAVPDLVLPGHPRADVSPPNPYLSQQRWESLLDEGIRDMKTLLARYEVDGADFLDGVPKELLPDMYYLGDLNGAAVYGFFAASRFFVIDAPGGPGLVDFLNARLRRLGHKSAWPTAVLLTSCSAATRAGLTELVTRCHAQVVASADGLETLKESCPAGTVILSPQELNEKGWFPVTPVAVRGRGFTPIAYKVAWAGKTVLFSGEIPVKINHDSAERLISDLMSAGGNLRDYFTTLTQLHTLNPDLYLPLNPIDGQNANLYDDDWGHMIEDNLVVIKTILTSSRKS
jgi:glyoxylase-like metal-dependent hydrolase (beta-lactamase superfamily II)